jgi:hypothetical protein
VVLGAIRRLAALTLVGQLATLTLSPVILAVANHDVGGQLACTCAHDGAAQCPMHHPTGKPNPCSCRSTADPSAGLALLFGQGATLSASPAVVGLMPITVFRPSHTTLALQSGFHPEAPPPRS